MTFPRRAFRRPVRLLVRRLATLSIALLTLLALAHPSRSLAAENPDLQTVLTGSRHRIEALDYRVTGRLTQIGGDGKRTTYKFAAKAHWFPDGLRLLATLTDPASQKTTLLAHMTATGHLTIEAQLPGEKAATTLPYEHWGEPLLGSNFSYEDMVESQYFWKTQELLPSQKYGARDCFVLKSTPSPQDHSDYDSVTSWIDRGIVYPVQVVKALHGTGRQKEFLYYGLRQNGGAWSASQIEAKVVGKPGSSILAIEAGTPKAKLTRQDFVIGAADAPAEPAK